MKKDKETDLELVERMGREMKMPRKFMATVRVMLAPEGIDYAALKAMGIDPAIAFQAEALAESVSPRPSQVGKPNAHRWATGRAWPPYHRPGRDRYR
jgi:hypothetical protein